MASTTMHYKLAAECYERAGLELPAVDAAIAEMRAAHDAGHDHEALALAQKHLKKHPGNQVMLHFAAVSACKVGNDGLYNQYLVRIEAQRRRITVQACKTERAVRKEEAAD